MYFVTKGGSNTPLDAREIVGINVTALGAVQSPASIIYRTHIPSGIYWRYDTHAFSIFLNNKIDKETEVKFEQALVTEIENVYRGTWKSDE